MEIQFAIVRSENSVAPAGYKNKQCRVSYTLPRATGI